MRLERKGESVFGQEKRSRPRCWEYALPCRLEGVDVSFPMLVNLPSGGPGVIGTEELPDERTKMLRTILRLAEDKELPTRAVWVGPKSSWSQERKFWCGVCCNL
jgi:hypothetical protein